MTETPPYPGAADGTLFLDTNILMYAAGSDHPLREPCRQVLERAVEADVPLVTDAEVLQEILYRYLSIGRPEVARTVHDSTILLCVEIFPIDQTHTSRALELLLGHPALSPRDAIHVAVMEARGLTRLLSTDRDFDRVPGVDRIEPGAFVP